MRQLQTALGQLTWDSLSKSQWLKLALLYLTVTYVTVAVSSVARLPELFYLLPLAGAYYANKRLAIFGTILCITSVWIVGFLLPLLHFRVLAASIPELLAETVVGLVVMVTSVRSIRSIHVRDRRLQAARSENLDHQMRRMAYHWAVAIDARHSYTAGHSQRVAQYAVVLARVLPGLLESMDVSSLWLAGMLHDVGKIGVPDHILSKESPLTPEEYRTIQQHTTLGYSLVQRTGASDQIAQVVLHHHERYDGKGYPDRLRGAEIPLAARVMAVADSFDAMTSMRPYRTSLNTEQALLEIVKGTATQFDPEVVEALLKVFPTWQAMYTRFMAKSA